MMLNPILRREARTSLRSWKMFAVICAYVGFIAFVSYVFINSSMWSSVYSGFDPQNIVHLYALLSGLQLGFILITTPALTAGSISGERERQTLDLLVITKMSPFSIVFGKLISSIGLVLLLIIAAMPVYAVLFYFGGVSIASLFAMTLFMLTTSCMVGAMSIMFSSLYKKTMVSMVIVYLLCGLLCIGTWVMYMLYQYIYIYSYLERYDYLSIPAVYGFMFLNPGAGFFSVIDAQLGTRIFDGLILNYNSSSGGLPIPIWIVNIISDIVFTVIFLKVAAKNINPLKKTK